MPKIVKKKLIVIVTVLLDQVTGARLGFIANAVGNVSGGLLIGFLYSWKLTLVIVAFMPLAFIGALVQMRLQQGHSTIDKKAMEDSGKVKQIVLVPSIS